MANKWPQVSLGELLRLERRPVEIRPNEQYQEIGIYCFGRGIFHKTPRMGFEVGEKDLFLLKEGDFILQVTFAWEGAVAVVSAVEEGMYGSTRYPTFRVDEDRCIPEFLLHYFKTHAGLQQLIKISPGSAGRNRVLSIKRIPEIFIPLPSLAEQRRIVARIEQFSASIESARVLRNSARQETGALTDSRLRSTFDLLGKQYGTEQLTKVILEAAYGTSAKCLVEREKGAIPVLRIPNISSEQLELNDLKFANLSGPELKRLRLCRGDVLIVRTNGSVNLVGRSAVAGELHEPTAFASYIIRLRLDEASILPAYAQWMLRHLRISGQMVDFARTTAGQYNVSLGRLRSARIPIPPVPEQHQVVSALENFQTSMKPIQSLQEQTAKQLDALMPSILDKAFSGEL